MNNHDSIVFTHVGSDDIKVTMIHNEATTMLTQDYGNDDVVVSIYTLGAWWVVQTNAGDKQGARLATPRRADALSATVRWCKVMETAPSN